MAGVLGMAPMPAEHCLPKIPESESVQRLAQGKMEWKGESLGKTELRCTVTKGLSNAQIFFLEVN